MTLELLIARLQSLQALGLPGETQILLASDEEGNQIRDMDSYGVEWGNETLDGWDLIDQEDLEDYAESENLGLVLVLWP